MEYFMEDFGDWIWDESEYNFFMSLNDVDKLEYVFDFFNFSEEDFEDVVFEFEPESDKEMVDIPVDVTITDTHLIISCIDDSIIDRTIIMFKLNGAILIPQERNKGSRIYKYAGNSSPISLN